MHALAILPGRPADSRQHPKVFSKEVNKRKAKVRDRPWFCMSHGFVPGAPR